MGRKYETVIGTINRLEKKGFVKKYGRKWTGKGTTPWVYEITEKGKKLIRIN